MLSFSEMLAATPPLSLAPFPWHLTCASGPCPTWGTADLISLPNKPRFPLTQPHITAPWLCLHPPAPLSHASYCLVASAPGFPSPNLTLELWTWCVSHCWAFLQDGWVPPGRAPQEPWRSQPGLSCLCFSFLPPLF